MEMLGLEKKTIQKYKTKAKDLAQTAIAYVNDIDKAVVKATNRKNKVPKEKHVRTILLKARTMEYPVLCKAIFKRLHEHEWQTVLKALVVVHRTLRDGSKDFTEECAKNKQHFHLASYYDKTNAEGRDQTLFIREYAQYIEEYLHTFKESKFRPPEHDGYDDHGDRESHRRSSTREKGDVGSMAQRDLIKELPSIQRQLHAAVTCIPQGSALRNSITLCAYTLVLKDTFRLYRIINEGMLKLLDAYFDMEKDQAQDVLEMYKVFVADTDKLIKFYDTAKESGAVESRAIPDVKPAPPDFLGAMEDFLAGKQGARPTFNRDAFQEPDLPDYNAGADDDDSDDDDYKSKAKGSGKSTKDSKGSKTQNEPDLLLIDEPLPVVPQSAAFDAGTDFFSTPVRAAAPASNAFDPFGQASSSNPFAAAPGNNNPFAAPAAASSNPFDAFNAPAATTPPQPAASSNFDPFGAGAANPFGDPSAGNSPGLASMAMATVPAASHAGSPSHGMAFAPSTLNFPSHAPSLGMAQHQSMSMAQQHQSMAQASANSGFGHSSSFGFAQQPQPQFGTSSSFGPAQPPMNTQSIMSMYSQPAPAQPMSGWGYQPQSSQPQAQQPQQPQTFKDNDGMGDLVNQLVSIQFSGKKT